MTTENNIAGAQESIEIVGGDMTQLSIDSSQIDGMSLHNEALVITFKDGGTLSITNFREMADSHSEIILQDGTVYDAQALYSDLSGALPPVAFQIPGEGQSLVYDLEAGHKYTFPFDPQATAGVVEEDGSLIISFDNDGRLILQNFQEAMDAEDPAEMMHGDEYISLREFSETLRLADAINDQMDVVEEEVPVQQAEIRQQQGQEQELAALAQELAEVEPAAGDAAGGAANRGGFGFQSSVDSAPLNSPDAIGPIGPTELQFGLPEFQDEVFPRDELASNGPNYPKADPPWLETADVQVKEDGSVFVPVGAGLTDTDGSEFLTITVTGVPASWGFSGIGWTQPAPGIWAVVMPNGVDYNDGFTLTPPAESDVDLTGIVVTAKSTENNGGDTATTSQAIDVIVDAVADDPTVDGLDNSGREGEVLAVDVSGSLGTDVDGSEHITGYEISGVPAGFSFNAGTDLGGGVWSFTPAEIAGLQVTPPADYVGQVGFAVTIFTTENPVSDGEFDTTDNNNQATDQFTLTWAPVVNPPEVLVNGGVDDAVVKEDSSVDVPIVANLDPAGSGNEVLTVVVTGIDSSWGFSAPVGTYDATAGTWTWTGPAGTNLSTVMTFTPPADSDLDLTGLSATATAFEPATSTSASDTDGFNIITDAVADTPTLDAQNASGEEGTTIPLTIATAVTDVDGSEVIDVVRISDVPLGATLTAGTEVSPGVWELSTSDLTGLGINIPNGVTGAYTLDVESVATEAPVSDSEVDYTDNEASAFDVIKLCIKADDVPDIKPEEQTVDETNLGPIVLNDSVSVNYGADTGAVAANGGFFSGVPLTSGGVAVMVALAGNTYTGTAGAETIFTLELQPSGDYTFTLLGTLDHPDVTDHNDAIMLQFGLTATDNEGDATDSVITINVLDDGLTAHDDVNDYQTINGGTDGNVITGLNGGAGAADDLSNDTDNTVTSVRFGTTVVDVPANGSATIDGIYGQLEIFSNGDYNYTLTATPGSVGGTASLNPVSTDVSGTQDTITKDGITVSISNPAKADISWVDTADGSGLGIDDLTAGDSTKVWPKGEAFDISFDNAADAVAITISELGDNNNNGDYGLDYVLTLADGTTVSGEQQFVSSQIVNGEFVFKLDAADYGQDIASVNITSVNSGQYKGASFLLNNVETTYSCGHECPIDVFEYTLTDGDGDTSIANLTLDGECPTVTIDVKVNQGVDDAIVKEDGSVFIAVDTNVAGGNGNEVVTLLLTGVAAQWGFSGTGWAATGTPGQYSITLPAGQLSYNGGFTLVPPADSDIDLTGLNVTASVFDPDTGATTTADDGFNVTVDAVADDPTINANGDAGRQGETLDIDVNAAVTDLDGSEHITGYEISGVPAGFSFNAGTDLGGGVWSFTPAEIAGLQVTPTASYVGQVGFAVTVFTTENPVSDGEFDTTDNNNQATDSICLSWCPVLTPPDVEVNQSVDDICVKEDGSVDVPLEATLGANGTGNEILTVVVTGIDSSWGFSAPVGTYDATVGTWTWTGAAGENLSTFMTFTPAADSDVDLMGLVATATALDPSTGSTAEDTDAFNVHVDAVADAPELSVPGYFKHVVWQPTEEVSLNISAAVTDTDGSEEITKIVLELPCALDDKGAALNHGTEVSPGVWELTLADLQGLTMTVSGSMHGYHNIKVTAYAEEVNLSGQECDTSDNIASVCKTFCFKIQDDPLVVDLDGDGVELVSADEGVVFDKTGDGVADQTDWVGAGDGLLTLDKNDDGVVNDSSELFGGNGVDGFDALASHDQNGDGVINQSDEVWNDLKVWNDANQDGVSQEDELYALDDLGMESISLDKTVVNVETENGTIMSTATVSYKNGDTAEVASVGLSTVDGAHIDEGVTIEGTDGRDELYGSADNDTLVGGSGDDVLYGGAGADSFQFAESGRGTDIIADFSLEEGDSLDMSQLLDQYDPTTDAINDFVYVNDNGTDTTIAVDVTGSGNAANAVSVVVLQGVSGLSVEDLVSAETLS